ncbi:MAG: septal ring lytic transglycosylase RlpA family protein [Geminicoccaceae bacterium]
MLQRRALLLALAAIPFAAPARAGSPWRQTGRASWYRAHQGITASGARQAADALTAAHRSLPFGSRIRVTNLRNGRSLEVIVTDRGPFTRGRILDVSEASARRLGFLAAGTAEVLVETA